MEKAVRLGRLARVKRTALELTGRSSHHLGDRAGLEVHFAQAVRALWTAYQPIVRYSERRVVAFEALMRSEVSKLPNPDALLGAADRLGRLPTLGRAVRKHVGATIAPTDVAEVFVNIHPTDLMDDDLFASTSALSGIAERVVLELTERASLDDVRDIRSRISSLRDLGFRIAVDDIGAGYAGLASIAQLEPDVMKLDMALVRNINAEPTKQRLVAAMTSLCSELRVDVIAEGVETRAERDTLVSLGCDLMQGFLFARPAKPFPEVQF
jgi:EAL domain-containing protein (putative c-di-GMP-specific phosphodiesterase class I)